jgi:hypothetical protein
LTGHVLAHQQPGQETMGEPAFADCLSRPGSGDNPWSPTAARPGIPAPTVHQPHQDDLPIDLLEDLLAERGEPAAAAGAAPLAGA